MEHNELGVFVPTDGSLIIDQGSGIVGTPIDNDRLVIDFEGNRYGFAGGSRFANRVNVAAGRHTTRYPTMARQTVPADAMIQVGILDTVRGEVVLFPGAAGLLAEWLGHMVTRDDLQIESARYERRRGLDRLAAGTPVERMQAKMLRRQHPNW